MVDEKEKKNGNYLSQAVFAALNSLSAIVALI